MQQVVVIGGGLSGLAAARAIYDEAATSGAEVTVRVLERDEQLGGKIRSTREEGYLCEQGPNGFLDNKPATLALVKRLGVEDRLLKSNDGARKRFIFTDGELRQLPEDPMSFLLSDILSIRGKLRLASEIFLPVGDAEVDESVAGFVRRRLGEEALDKLIDPMSAGIYAGDPSVMSLRSCFPKVSYLEQQFGGLLKGMLGLQKMAKAMGQKGPQGAGPGGVLWSFGEGAAELISLLARSLPPDTVHAGVAAAELLRDESGWVVGTERGDRFKADAVVLAIPAYDAAKLLRVYDEALAELLFAIPYVPAAVVCTGFAAETVEHPLDGFGFLIPKSERRKILGSLWSSSIFAQRAPDGHVLLTQIVGGARNPEVLRLSDDEMLRVVREELEWTMGIRAKPTYAKVVRWERAIPQYVVGHDRRLAQAQERVAALGGLLLGGNAYYGIGINDCTGHAVQLAPQVLQMLHGAQGGQA